MWNVSGCRVAICIGVAVALILATSGALADAAQYPPPAGAWQGMDVKGLHNQAVEPCATAGQEAQILPAQGTLLCCCVTITGQRCCAQSVNCSYSPPGCLCRR
jgi:hypothetical protein